jgi:hypothetical protein
MVNTLENTSGIGRLKWKFFTYRALSYFSFLCVPVFVQKGMHLSMGLEAIFMTLYILFIVGQWFLLGKEIDHRFKIYFRVNSSIDRVVYRLFLGMIFFVILFNFISFLESRWIANSVWTIWISLGLFYSWPTRGKIIQESVSSNFGEFKFLDGFEKTLLSLILLMYFFSLPDLPPLVNIEMLKLYYDPMEKMGNSFFNFLIVNYYPFKNYPGLIRLAWSLHFYVVGMGFFLLVFYALLRFFVSRRLSLLGVFALVSSWSFSKTLNTNVEFTLITTYSVLWLWTILWVTKSSTYRAGLFMGLVSYWGALLNPGFGIFAIFQLGFLYFIFLKDRTFWYKRQLFKYSLFGTILTVIYFFNHIESLDFTNTFNGGAWDVLRQELERKGFYILAVLGFLVLLIKIFWNSLTAFQIETENIKMFLLTLLLALISSILGEEYFLKGFSMMWILSFLSLIPLELVFQSISRLRSNRNMIYLIYILICLLDSHFEGRVKVFLKIFNS